MTYSSILCYCSRLLVAWFPSPPRLKGLLTIWFGGSECSDVRLGCELASSTFSVPDDDATPLPCASLLWNVRNLFESVDTIISRSSKASERCKELFIRVCKRICSLVSLDCNSSALETWDPVPWLEVQELVCTRNCKSEKVGSLTAFSDESEDGVNYSLWDKVVIFTIFWSFWTQSDNAWISVL